MVHSSPFINQTPLLPIVEDHLHGPLQSSHQPDTTAAYSRGSSAWSTPFHLSTKHVHIYIDLSVSYIQTSLQTELHAHIFIHKHNISPHTWHSPAAPQNGKHTCANLIQYAVKYCIFAKSLLSLSDFSQTSIMRLYY